MFVSGPLEPGFPYASGPMDCPRCTAAPEEATAYRGTVAPRAAPRLEPETHRSGPTVARCPSCRGAFVEHEALVTIENRTRTDRTGRADFRRTFDPPTDAIACPSCQGETTRREWSIGTLVFVDVCVECRGVWLDSGELETLTGERITARRS